MQLTPSGAHSGVTWDKTPVDSSQCKDICKSSDQSNTHGRPYHMGIESELVDAEYPIFLVYNKSWEKMKKEFYGIEEVKMPKS